MILEQPTKPTMGGGKIMIDGYLGEKTQHFTVYDPEGIAPTLAACDSKDPTKIVLRKEQ